MACWCVRESEPKERCVGVAVIDIPAMFSDDGSCHCTGMTEECDNQLGLHCCVGRAHYLGIIVSCITTQEERILVSLPLPLSFLFPALLSHLLYGTRVV